MKIVAAVLGFMALSAVAVPVASARPYGETRVYEPIAYQEPDNGVDGWRDHRHERWEHQRWEHARWERERERIRREEEYRRWAWRERMEHHRHYYLNY
jgi:hypothetical protein